MATTEHSVLIALRELDNLEQQRRDSCSRATCAVACIRSMLEAWAGATPMVFKRC